MQARAVSRDKGIPTAAYGITFNDPRARTEDEFKSIDARLTLPLAASAELQLRGRFDDYKYFGSYPSGNAEVSLLEDNDIRGGGAEGVLTWDPAPAVRIITGLEVNWYNTAQYRAWQEQDTSFVGDFPYEIVSAYSQAEVRLSSLVRLYAGLRHDRSTLGGDAFSPRGSLIITPDDATAVKLMWGKAFRTPNVYEREYFAADHKVAVDLDPERVKTAEIVLERRASRAVALNASIFFSRVDRLIDTALDEADDRTYFTNRDEVTTSGGELSIIWRADQNELRFTYSFSDAKTGDARMTNSPAHMLRTRATFMLPRGVLLSAALRGESERLTVYGTETAANMVADLLLRSPVVRGFSAMLDLRNAFNSHVDVPGGWEHAMRAIRQDGRTIGMGLEWQF